MLTCRRRRGTSTPANAAGTAVPLGKEAQSPATYRGQSRQHYALHFVFISLILFTHQAFAQSAGGSGSSNGTRTDSEGLTTSDPSEDRRDAGGDGIRNNRWSGRRRRRLSRAAVVGICIGIVILVVDLTILIIWLRRRKLRKAQEQARETLAQEQEANRIDGNGGVTSLKMDTEGSLMSTSPACPSPHPLLLPGAGGHDGGNDGRPSRRSNSFQRLSRYGSAKWKEFRLLGSRDKPTPPAPKSNKQSAHTLPLYTPPTFDSLGDQDEDEQHLTPTSSPHLPPRLPEVQAGPKDEITIQLDPSLSFHTLSPETANSSVVKLGGAATPLGAQWSPSSPASSSTVPGYHAQQQLWSAPSSPSGQHVSNSYYHE